MIIRKMTDKTKEIFHRVLKTFGICLFVIFIAEMTVTLVTQHQVNKLLGFNYATPETPEGEFFIITRVSPGDTMDKAGLKPEDQVQMDGTGELYKLLMNNQGKDAEFTVLRGRKEITIIVRVPEMDLPLRKVSFLF